VPLSAILCGEFAALSTMVMAAVSGPAAAGAKCPWMLQFAPAARLVPQEFPNTNEEASVPVTLMLVMDRAWPPVLVMVMYCDAVADPTATLPNAALVVERDTTGPTPVPVSAMLCGDPGALSVMVTAAVSEPLAAGSKFPEMAQ